MENQKMYWEIENYSSNVITLIEEGQKIDGLKLSKKQVEELTGKKLKVSAPYENPDFICVPYVVDNGQKYLDCRRSLRGNRKFYTVINN